MVEAANAASNFVGYLRKSWPESLRATVSPLTYRVIAPVRTATSQAFHPANMTGNDPSGTCRSLLPVEVA